MAASVWLLCRYVAESTIWRCNHFSDQQTEDLILQQAGETDPAKRTQEIEDIQTRVAELLSTVPLLQGAQVAVAGTAVEGVTLDASFKFRFAPLTK